MRVIDELTMTTSYMHLAIFICNFIKTCILNEQYQNIDLVLKNEITKIEALIVFFKTNTYWNYLFYAQYTDV